ncbi:MAG: P-II family nitrogen regulator [Acidobacteria bacterium]|nr:MAG: P-II family nitrogen regulator [Acidobacteriota bacterium]REJ99442.1 MAG: P-II family nitrogen regulator [Acidobacteriota bacterium]
MKYLVAVIQPDRLNAVLDALQKAEIHLVTVSQVMGRGRQKGLSQVYRSHKEAGSLLRKVKLEIAVNDDFVEAAVDAIRREAHSGEIGDGKIFVMALEECYRIRTGETGSVAIG